MKGLIRSFKKTKKGEFFMKKITKTLVAILLIAIMSLTSLTAFAAEGQITPRLSHTDGVSFYFTSSSSGGYIKVFYDGYDSFVRADLTVKVQKRFLLVFWNDVTEWSTSSTSTIGSISNTLPLNGSGTYRATFTLTVTGNNGTVDTITETIESQY